MTTEGIMTVHKPTPKPRSPKKAKQVKATSAPALDVSCVPLDVLVREIKRRRPRSVVVLMG